MENSLDWLLDFDRISIEDLHKKTLINLSKIKSNET